MSDYDSGKVTATVTPSGTQDVNVVNTPTVNVGTMPEVEIKNDSGNPVPVSGTVAVSNLPVTQPVSGTVTANAGTGPFPVSDNGGSLTVDGSVSVSNFPVTQPVSGSISVSNLPATQPVSAVALPLPSGASTEATLALIKAKTDNLDVALSTRTKPADTQPVSAASLPLPTGAATSALQTQPGVDIGDVTVNNASGASAVNVQDGGNSITVDGAFFPATQPISAVSLPLPTGAATSALQTQPGVDIGDVTVNNASGASAVNVQDGGNSLTVDGSVSVSNFPATQPVSGSVSVSNFPATQPVSGTVNTKTALTAASPTSATVGITSASAVAANASRKGLVLTNLSSNTISFGLGATAVLNSGITLQAGAVWEMDEYTFTTAAINAIASGLASILGIQEFA